MCAPGKVRTPWKPEEETQKTWRRASCLRCQGQVVLRRAGQRGPRPPLIQMHAVKFFTGDLSRRAQPCAVSDCEKLGMGGQVEAVIHLEGGSARGPPGLTLATFQQAKQPQTNGGSHHIPQIHTERLCYGEATLHKCPNSSGDKGSAVFSYLGLHSHNLVLE